MITAVRLGLLSGALALSNDKVEMVARSPLFYDVCPSDYIQHKGECQPATYDSSSTFISNSTFQSNLSKIPQSLDEARTSAAQVEGFPWTFWPQCFAGENTAEPYCVFSDQDFASGRGIFIVGTETFAHEMLENDAFRRPETLARMNKYETPPFEQHDFPDKGRGLIANKTLHRGDQIFASTPLLITDPGVYQLSTSKRLALLYHGIETLPPSSQSLFWDLLGHFKKDPVDDRINTNIFEVNIAGTSQSALFPEIAMINHDCRPNAAYFWDANTMTQYVHAIRDILPGEELTVTYIDNEDDRARRMRKLRKNWGFKCSCSACTAHPALVAESDSRLYQIASLYRVLEDWSPHTAATPEAAELLISLYQQERLHSNLATAYKYAAEVSSSFGRKYEAMRYARLSTEMSMLDKGFWDVDVKDMREMSSNPELSWSWKKRVGLGGKGACACGHQS